MCRPIRAFTLTESIIAFFLLATVVLFVIVGFGQALRYQTRAALRQKAVLIAARTMDQVRNWAKIPENYDSDWSSQNVAAAPDPQEPDFSVRVQANANGQDIYKPCFTLEEVYGSRADIMHRSVVPVKVTVSWNSSLPNSNLALVSYIGEPARPAQPTLVIQRTAGTEPLLQGETLSYKVSALDLNGRPITDLTFIWSVLPITANAWVLNTGNRNGQEQTIKNTYFQSNGTEVHVGPGRLKVQAWTLYHGKVLKGTTDDVVLQ